MSVGISGKVVIITGASSGIGAYLARYLYDKGAIIVIAARRVEELQKVAQDCCEGNEEFDRILIQRCDVTKRVDHEALRDIVLEKFGKIDCWINNAGVGLSKSVLSLTDEDVDLMISINTKSVLYGMQTVVPYFKERGEGQIINVGSLLGRTPVNSMRAMYSASKAAMASLTCNMRVDLQNEGFDKIFVALFSPGVVATDFGLNSVGGGPDSKTLPGAQPVEEVIKLIGDMVEQPAASVDQYSRPTYRTAVAAYYSTEDVRTIETKPLFASPSFVAKSAVGNHK